MQVYKKILVTIDCSPTDAAILEHVIALAQQNEAHVVLLHVVHSYTLDQHRTMTASAREALAGYQKDMSGKNVDVEVLLRSGEPDDEILNEIDEGDYDLVAMGTHGHRFFGDLLFGSVSHTLKHRIRIPLLLLRS